MSKDEFISVKGLKKGRSWTDTLIERFLGEPDKLVINKYYRSGPRVRLYKLERVLQAEETSEFKAAFVISQKRSMKAKEAAEKGIDTKIDKLCDEILGITGDSLPDFTPEELTLAACKNYNSLGIPEHIYFKIIESGGDFREASPQSEKPFLDRITVNYLRHTYFGYDESLSYIDGRVGKDIAYSMLREEIDEAIHEKYPWLKTSEEEAA
jgi:hypothetical protein